MGVADVHMGANVEMANVEGVAVTSLVESDSHLSSQSPEGLNSLVLCLSGNNKKQKVFVLNLNKISKNLSWTNSRRWSDRKMIMLYPTPPLPPQLIPFVTITPKIYPGST